MTMYRLDPASGFPCRAVATVRTQYFGGTVSWGPDGLAFVPDADRAAAFAAAIQASSTHDWPMSVDIPGLYPVTMT